MDDFALLAAILSAVAGTETWTVEEVDALRQGSVEIGGPGSSAGW